MILTLRNVQPDTTPREPAPVRISVVMMVGNEAHFVEDAIRSASFADEIVVLDTGSTDGTGSIAAALGARVTREERIVDLGDGLHSIDDFGAARTRAIELACGDWVVLLDADERFAECGALREVLETMPDAVDYGAMRLDHVNRGELNQSMTRLFRRSARPTYEHRVHETAQRWAEGRGHVTLPREAGYVVHLGGEHSTRARHRRDDRNWRLVQRALADNPNDVHALTYAVETLSGMGLAAEAETLAHHAFGLVRPSDPARHRIALAMCEFMYARADVAGIVTMLDDLYSRWTHCADSMAAHGLALMLAGRIEEGRGRIAAALESPDEMSPVMLDQACRALRGVSDAA